MSQKTEYSALKQISAVVATIAFIADLITIFFFAKDLLFSFESISFETTLTQFFLIALVFAFAISLFHYSREISEGLDAIVKMFGWFYIILAAIIFMIVSFRFIVFEDYSVRELIAYPLLVIFVLGLGIGVTMSVKGDIKYYSVPFMVVALEQIALWVIKILAGDGISFTFTFMGNLCVFVFVGLIILLLLLKYKRESRDSFSEGVFGDKN